MSENKEHEVRKDHSDAGVPNTQAAPSGPGEYVEGDYGDAGTLDTGTTPTETGEYVEGDYGDAGTTSGSSARGPAPGRTPKGTQTAPEGLNRNKDDRTIHEE